MLKSVFRLITFIYFSDIIRWKSILQNEIWYSACVFPKSLFKFLFVKHKSTNKNVTLITFQHTFKLVSFMMAAISVHL